MWDAWRRGLMWEFQGVHGVVGRKKGFRCSKHEDGARTSFGEHTCPACKGKGLAPPEGITVLWKLLRARMPLSSEFWSSFRPSSTDATGFRLGEHIGRGASPAVFRVAGEDGHVAVFLFENIDHARARQQHEVAVLRALNAYGCRPCPRVSLSRLWTTRWPPRRGRARLL